MTSHARGGWLFERRSGTAQALHDIVENPARLVRRCDVTGPALVLGSTQSDTIVDPLRLHSTELARRRSGGGLVPLHPDASVWIDVIVPFGDPLWQVDIGRSFEWLGDLFARVVGGGSEPHRGALVAADGSNLVCFLGTGPGELVSDGRKLVGVSQRRTREWCRFQCVAYMAPIHALVVDALVIDESRRSALAAQCDSRVGVVEMSADDFWLGVVGALST